jgi:hypothetical protein
MVASEIEWQVGITKEDTRSGTGLKERDGGLALREN